MYKCKYLIPILLGILFTVGGMVYVFECLQFLFSEIESEEASLGVLAALTSLVGIRVAIGFSFFAAGLALTNVGIAYYFHLSESQYVETSVKAIRGSQDIIADRLQIMEEQLERIPKAAQDAGPITPTV